MEKSVSAILIANRGEIAIRIARSLAEGGIRTVGVYASGDAGSLHVRRVDMAVPLTGAGAPAYLDGEQLIQVARDNGCQAIHPGYGFLSENAEFAKRCRSAGLIFIGPSPDCLALLGDKARARALAEACGVPLAEGTTHAVSLEEAIGFLEAMKASYGPGAGIMIKALAGGGGRGMRPVSDMSQVPSAYRQSASEAGKAFGNESVYVERLISHARHIEVQVLGDADGAVSHLWERDCSLQRRCQKLVEFAPAPGLSLELRRDLIKASLRMAEASGLQGLATFEFLLDLDTGGFVFMEANPRLQVEHTVTEALTGVDLVAVQTALATGHSLATLGLGSPAAEPPDRMAIQLRINLESLQPDGTAVPASGTIVTYEPPGGPGVRVDGTGYAGLEVSTEYDSLLAKLVVCGQSAFPAVVDKAYRTLCEFRLEGVPNNLLFLRNLLSLPEMQTYAVSTATVADNLDVLIQAGTNEHRNRYFEALPLPVPATEQQTASPEDGYPILSPVHGRVSRLFAGTGDMIQEGQIVALVEAMKMEFEVKATASGEVLELLCSEGASIGQDCPILVICPDQDAETTVESELELDLDAIRQDLSEVRERHSRLYDDQRPEAVAKRRRTGQRTARENVDDLLDEDSFVEYGALALAARRRRHSEKELMAVSPADGLIAGLGTVNGGQYGAETARCMVLAYDYTVFAGTQGVMNHKKTDRMLQLAKRWSLPLVLFAEGGGGRPGDTDFTGVAGLDCHTFTAMAALSGQVPLVGIASGRCFAGNAALLGCCDVIIATRNATIGMAGPAMIEGGGLGRFRAEEVGPVSVQAPNGVVDIVVEDEAEAVQTAKHYLSFAQGRKTSWEAPDQRLLRHLIPENRLRAYDVRQVIEALADEASVLELRRDFAQGMITCLARAEGHAFGLMANNPRHLGGAIDAEAGDKAARFMRLCDALGLPILSLCDTPGFMVGPEAEKQATVRHVSRMFVAAARLQVPFFTVVLRKGYGLGAQAMAAGSFHSPMFTIGWPSSEFGAMGLEGAVRLGFAKELAAVEDEQERQALFEKMVAKAYEQGKGMNMASYLEIDAVIDPADTRRWLIRGVESVPESKTRQRPGGGVAHDLSIDTW